MIFPLGTSEIRRRPPWATVTLIALNVVAFLLTHHAARQGNQRLTQAVIEEVELERALELRYLKGVRHPPPFLLQYPRELTSRQVDFWERFERGEVVALTSTDYTEWRAAKDATRRATESHVLFRWGLRKSSVNPLLFFTSMFLHDGYLHLLFNTWFLWTVGCNMEDKWGRRLFLLFYFLGGVFAAASQAFFTPAGDDRPMVGASGAVASVMGAFMVRHFNVKIRFFSLFVYVGTFTARAGVILPIWFGLELKNALSADSAQGGVAFWAHVGGFVAGALVALAVKAGRVEDGIAPQLEAEVRARRKKELLSAAALHRGHRQPRLELEQLRLVLAEDPNDSEVRWQVFELLRLLRDQPAAQREAEVLLAPLWVSGRRDRYLEAFGFMHETGVPTTPVAITRAAQALRRTDPHAAATTLWPLVQAPPADELMALKALDLYAELLDDLGAGDQAQRVRQQAHDRRANPGTPGR